MQFIDRGSRRERFAPGQTLGKRYVIQGMLGEGAMGEVYRAEDRRLGGQVALKFLASHAAADAEGMRRLMTEASLARQITHPNVCRVYDIGDVDGHTFISMEYIDGESFGTLLKRIGRLPPDKALSVAHQICAGLAWAHERGIIHRDLKPTNVMLDGSGEVKIADFGLAGLTEDVRRDRHRAGTPAYMSPEQLRGEGVTPQSDIFSLGLVLYEMFTGKPVYRPSSIAELERMHEQPISPPSSIVPELDPAIDRAIMWCLERDPKRRPANVREVSAMLPGGNALAAAIMAGQTPTPGQVAAAGETGLISVPVAGVLAAVMFAAVMLAMFVAGHTSMLQAVPLTKPAAVLADKAEQTLESLGIEATTPYRAYAFDLYEEYIDMIRHDGKSESKWNRLALTRPAAIDFWYRVSPKPLVTQAIDQVVTFYDPPFDVPGMAMLRLDPKGRLRELQFYTPAEKLDGAMSYVISKPLLTKDGKPDFAKLFELAGLNIENCTPIPPVRVPPVYADVRAAWHGEYPESPLEKIRVEAAFLEGRPVSFRIVEENWLAASMPQQRDWFTWEFRGMQLAEIMSVATAVGAAVLAYRNLRLRRGDRDGAFRLAFLMLAVCAASHWMIATHPRSADSELTLLCRVIAMSLPTASWFWVFYIAVEPYVRRQWPETLIAWSRLMTGDWKNPLVGLHVAVGGLGGVTCGVVALVHRVSAPWVGEAPGIPWIDMDRGIDVLQGVVPAIGTALSILPYVAKFSLTFLLALIILKMLLRVRWLAALCYAMIQTSLWALSRGDSWLSWLFIGAIIAVAMLMLVRLGLLAMVSGGIFFIAITTFTPTFDVTRWYTPTAWAATFTLFGTFAVGIALACGLLAPARRDPLASSTRL